MNNNVGEHHVGATRRASITDSRTTDTLLPSPPGSSTSTVSMFSGPPSSSRESFSVSGSSNTASDAAGALTALTPNGKYYNPVVMSFIRDDWIQQQLHLRQSAYTAFQQTSIVTGTWNVNAKKPPTQPDDVAKLLQWLLPQRTHETAVRFPDILALGFQEIVDLNAVNVVVNSAVSAQRSAAWEDAVLAALNSQSPSFQYKTVLEKHLVGILLLVFVRVEHVAHVKDVRGATAGVGIMGMMGNKGGAAIRLGYYDSTLCFVCAHLAAHRENVAGRNADYLNILSKIDFRESDSDACFSTDTRQLSGEPPILNHDFVFWVGDLNYRITDDISVETVFYHAERTELTELLQLDQLTIERKRGHVFRGFDEGLITFPPTYKFQAGTMAYEKRPEKKLRAPAWCDRILWRAAAAEQLEQRSYSAIMALTLSDHKPVVASFDVSIRHQVDAKKAQVVRDIMLQLDKWENENMPRVRLVDSSSHNAKQQSSLDPTSGVLAFDHLKYGVDQVQTLWIENIGVVVAHFRFIPKLEDATVCQSWLTVAPTFGMIPPKQRIEIRITALVDVQVAHALSASVRWNNSLEDTMILRVENGRDYFLVVSGQYDPSCFGTSLEQLVVNHEAVRFAPQQQRPLLSTAAAGSSALTAPSTVAAALDTTASGSTSSSSNTSTQHIPKELWRMANDLLEQHLTLPNLFVEAGDKRELALLREALDTGSGFPDHSGYSTAELLLRWLASLHESVVPDAALAFALEAGHNNVAQTSRALLDALPPVRFNVVVYLVSFLKHVLKHRASNKLTPESLAIVFGRCFVSQYRAPPTGSALMTTHVRVARSPSAADGTSFGASAGGATVAAGAISPSGSASGTAASLSPVATAASPSAASNQSSSSSNLAAAAAMLPEETLRRSAREIEAAQSGATQRADKMAKLLLHLLTTTSL